MTGPHEQPGWLHTFILSELLRLRESLAALKASNEIRLRALESKIISPSTISSSVAPLTSTATRGSFITGLKEFGFLFVELYKMARHIPWGLIMFAAVAAWHWALPFLRKALQWFGLA